MKDRLFGGRGSIVSKVLNTVNTVYFLKGRERAEIMPRKTQIGVRWRRKCEKSLKSDAYGKDLPHD